MRRRCALHRRGVPQPHPRIDGRGAAARHREAEPAGRRCRASGVDRAAAARGALAGAAATNRPGAGTGLPQMQSASRRHRGRARPSRRSLCRRSQFLSGPPSPWSNVRHRLRGSRRARSSAPRSRRPNGPPNRWSSSKRPRLRPSSNRRGRPNGAQRPRSKCASSQLRNGVNSRVARAGGSGSRANRRPPNGGNRPAPRPWPHSIVERKQPAAGGSGSTSPGKEDRQERKSTSHEPRKATELHPAPETTRAGA